MGEFLEMGGYAAFVWPAYIISALGLGGLALSIWRRGKTLAKRLHDLELMRTQGLVAKNEAQPAAEEKDASNE